MNRDELLESVFGAADVSRPYEKKIFETLEGADVVSHVGLAYRRVLLRPATAPGPGVSDASELVTVAAITNVCTDPEHRGRGYARANVEAAHADAATHRMVAFAAVFADDDVFDGFFRKLGYARPTVGPAGFAVCALREGEEWPGGPADTMGRW